MALNPWEVDYSGGTDPTPDAQKKPWEQNFAARPVPTDSTASTPPVAKKPTGFFDSAVQGFKRSLPETESLLAGATAASAGLVGADGVRDWALQKYRNINKNSVQPLQSGASFTGALKGENSFGDWAGDTLGNFGGQALQSAALSTAGALAGAAAGAPEGGVGAIPGAIVGGVGGLVARGAVKRAITGEVRKLVEDQVAKGVAKDAAEAAGQNLLQRRLGQLGGAALAGTGLNVGQEVGTTYTGRADDAQQAGQPLTQGDAARALAFGVPAGLVDTAAEGLNVGRLLHGIPGKNLPARVLKGAAEGMLTEGGTEAVQNVLERAGAGQSVTSPEAMQDTLENFAAGALGGGVIGGVSGVHRVAARPVPQADQQETPTTLALPPPDGSPSFGVNIVTPGGTVLTPEQRGLDSRVASAPEPPAANPAYTDTAPRVAAGSLNQQPRVAARPVPRFADAAPGSMADAANQLPDAPVATPLRQQQAAEQQRMDLQQTKARQQQQKQEPAAPLVPAPWVDTQTGEEVRPPTPADIKYLLHATLDDQVANSKKESPALAATAVIHNYGLPERTVRSLAEQVKAERKQGMTAADYQRAPAASAADEATFTGSYEGGIAGPENHNPLPEPPRAAPSAAEMDSLFNAPPAQPSDQPRAEADTPPSAARTAPSDASEQVGGKIGEDSESSRITSQSPPATPNEPRAAENTAKLPPRGAAVPPAELVATKDMYGKTVHVHQADLASDRTQLRLYASTGRPVQLNGRHATIHRENLDADGSKLASKPALPYYAKVTKSGEKPFKTRALAEKELRTFGQSLENYDIVERAGGFIAVRKQAVPEKTTLAEAAHDAAAQPQPATRASSPAADQTSVAKPEAASASTPPADSARDNAETQQTPPQGGVSASGDAARFPRVDSVQSVPLGPTSIQPKVVAPGKVLHRETNAEGLHSLLFSDSQFTPSNAFVTDDPDLAIGQGDNRGIKVTFRPNSVSGREHAKPGTGITGGREYRADLIAPRAVATVTMPAGQVSKLRGVTKVRLQQEFDRTDLGKGQLQFTRKGLAPMQAQQESAGDAAAPSIAQAAHEAATSPQNDLPEPTDAQKEAGNYQKGHIRFNGYDISIENPAGSKRSPEWPALKNHYGYFKGTIGKDKDHVDVFLTDHAEDPKLPVYVVDQVNKDGSFDEHKVILGAANVHSARKTYLQNYEQGWTGLGAITKMSQGKFKTWLADPKNTQRPAGKLPARAQTNPTTTNSAETGSKPVVAQNPRQAAIQAGFAANRQAIKDKGLQKGDTVTWEADGKTRTGVINHLGDKEQAVVRVDVAGERGVADYHVGAARLTKVEPEATQDVPATTAEPATPKTSVAAASNEASNLQDFGEKIGGARKDMEQRAPKKTGRKPKSESGQSWRNRYIAAPYTGNNAMLQGKWFLLDKRKRSSFGGNEKVGDRYGYDSEEAANAAVPLVEVARNHRVYNDGMTEAPNYAIFRNITDKKRVRIKDGFATREEALHYMADHAADIIDTNTTFGEESLPVPPLAKREGPARREGDATPKMFADTFGFRGVEFGNWIGNAKTKEQSERQNALNHAFDALADMADILGVPPRALSLNGELALAFGARGHGLTGAKAHYESDYGVINLTKMKGAGSLAHEWLHALDHYLGRQDGKAAQQRQDRKPGEPMFNDRGAASDFASYGFRGAASGVRAELRTALASVIETMTSREKVESRDAEKIERFVGTIRDELTKKLSGLREGLATEVKKDDGSYRRPHRAATSEELAEFDAIASQMLAGENIALSPRLTQNPRKRNGSETRWTNDLLERMNTLYQSIAKRSGMNAERKGELDTLGAVLGTYDRRLKDMEKANAGEGKKTRVPTEFFREARELDQGRGGEYWTTTHELLARAFSAYVEDRAAERGVLSEYLTYSKENLGIITPWGLKRPFPFGEERRAINEAFDHLFDVVESREDEATGNVVLQHDAPSADGLQVDELSDTDLTDTERDQLDDREIQAQLARESREEGRQDAERLGLHQAVQAALGDVAVEYLRGYDGLPEANRIGVEQRTRARGGSRSLGLYVPSTGKVYLFTDTIESSAAAMKQTPQGLAVWTAAHEIAGHHGLRKLLGGKLNPALDVAGHNPTVRALAKAIATQRRWVDAAGKTRSEHYRTSIEEALAELAAASRTGNFEHIQSRYGVAVQPGLRQRVATTIQRFLRELKLQLMRAWMRQGRGGITVTDEHVRSLLEAAWQASRTPGPTLASLDGTRLALDQVAGDANDRAQPQTIGNRNTGIGVERAQARVAALTKDWGKNQPKVRVVADGEGFPAAARAANPNYRTAEGVHLGDTVYLNAAALGSEQRLGEVLAHEVVGHHGIENVVKPQEWEGIVRATSRWNDIAAGRLQGELGPRVRSVVEDVQRRYPNADPTTFAKETIAVLAERSLRLSPLMKVVSAVRRYLRQVLPGMKWSENDVIGLLGAADSFLRSDRAARSHGPDAVFAQERSALRDEQDFQRSLRMFVNKTLSGVQQIRVTQGTPDVLRKLGFGDYPIKVSQRILSKILNPPTATEQGHEIPVSELNKLVRGLHEPLAVFKSHDPQGNFRPDDLAILTEMQDKNGQPVMVALHLAKQGDNYLVHNVSSTYGRPERQFENWVKEGRLLYLDQSKTPAWLQSVARQFAQGGAQDGGSETSGKLPKQALLPKGLRAETEVSGGKVLTDADVVKPFSAGGSGQYSRQTEGIADSEADAFRNRVAAAGREGGEQADEGNSGQGPVNPGGGRPLFSQRPASEALDDMESVQRALNGDEVPLVDRAKKILEQLKPGNLKDALRGTWLGALTTRHLTELGGDYFGKTIGAYSDYLTRMQADRNQLQEEAEKIAEPVRQWASKNRPMAKRLFDLMHSATIQGVDPAEAYTPLMFRDAGGQMAEVTRKNVVKQKLVLREQMKGRSGDPKQNMIDEQKRLEAMLKREPERRQAYGPLVDEWNQLSPEAQGIYRQMRDAYKQRSDQMQEALIQRITDLKGDGVSDNQVRIMVNKLRQEFEDNRVQGVYFPLQRFGRYFVAAERGTGKDKATTYLMYDTPSDLKGGVKRLRADGWTVKAQGLKSDLKAKDAVPGSFLSDVIDILRKNSIGDRTQDEVYQAFLQTLPELSMRKHQIHRKNVLGFDRDAVRAFAWNMHHGSHQLARLRYAHKLQGVIDVLKKRQEGDRKEAGADTQRIVAGDTILQELDRRHEWIMNPTDSNATNLVSSAGFLYYLGATPAAGLVNLTQPAMISYPYLAARFGGVKAMNVMMAASRDSVRTLGNIHKTLTDPEERRAYAALQASGAIDTTQAHNLAGIAEGGVKNYNPAWAKAMQVIGYAFHKSEVVNRETTGMAAYRLARSEGMNFDAAVKFAHDAIFDTQFDYSNANRARFMQSGAAKTLLMFRQYGLNMSWLLGRSVWQAVKGESPEVQRVARRQLAGILGMTALFSGTLGLPMSGVLMGVLNSLASSFGDDDEPWDAETEFRAFLNDMLGQGAADVVLHGAANKLTGADIASRVGMNELWFRDADKELEGEGAYYNLLEQVAGPMGGVLKNVMVGKQLIDQGHIERGIEVMMPKALKDGMKGARYALQGVNTLRGDPLVADASVWESVLQGTGFTPSRVSKQYEVNNSLMNYQQDILQRRQRLMDAFAMALRLDDAEARSATLGKIASFNKVNPELAITPGSLRASIKSRARYSAQAENGIVLNPKLAARLRSDVGVGADAVDDDE